MQLDRFSPTRARVAQDLNTIGLVIAAPGTAEHKACMELVAFGRAFKLAGGNVFAPERRIDPTRS